MKKQVLLAGLVVIGGLSWATSVEATSVPTKGTIEFSANTGDEDEDKKVTDPGTGGDNKGDGGTITPPDGGGSTTGPLRFNYVPAINFGDNRLASKTQNYYALFDEINKGEAKEERPTFLEVVDLRGGTKGWSVQLKNNRVFTSEDNKTFNATLSFSDLTVQSNSSIADTAAFPVVPGRETETVVSTDAGSGVNLATASKDGQGYGSWSIRVGDTTKKTTGYGADGTSAEETGKRDDSKKDRNKAVKLKVDGGQVIDTTKTYTTDLVWELVAAP